MKGILSGKKTQTRRIIKPQPFVGTLTDKDGNEHDHWCIEHSQESKRAAWRLDAAPYWTHCRYGAVGDFLWVRETFCHCQQYDDADMPMWDEDEEPVMKTFYRATTPHFNYFDSNSDFPRDNPLWKSPLFMPRALSRIALELTDVRVERLNAISSRDAIAEGVNAFDGSDFPDPVGAYKDLWESLHGVDSWSAAPWVWVLSFKTHEIKIQQP